MRIQHNIMAMSAYRNYTNNVSAMKKNLEKLSSGYKINRAGDDAAGLAISEKMRAQITGLETAQKNAKDGISLVQTAEGALTEVHDMLNRMVELATQSANGTYDNTTDRKQMQKEINQLSEEINRIADSSNFNGIKLLDGTLGLNTDAFSVKTGAIDAQEAVAAANVDMGSAISSYHGGKDVAAVKPKFEIDVSEITVKNKATSSATVKFDVEFGGITLKASVSSVAAGSAITSTQIASAIAAALTNAANAAIHKNGSGSDACVTIGGLEMQISSSNGKIKLDYWGTATGTSAVKDTSGDKITTDLAKAFNDEIGGSVTVSTTDTKTEVPDTSHNVHGYTTIQNAVGKESAKRPGADIDIKDFVKDGYTLVIGGTATGTKYLFKTDKDSDVEAENGETLVDVSMYDAADQAKMAALIVAGGAHTNAAGDIDGNAGGQLQTGGIFTISNNAAGGTKIHIDVTASSNASKADTEDKLKELVSVISPAVEERGAGSQISIKDASAIKAGDTLKIAGKTYVFDKTKSGAEGDVTYVKIDGDKTMENLKTAVATDTSVTVELSSDKKTLTVYGKTFDSEVPTINGKGLTLQIGDTADSFNQLNVTVPDMHTVSQGIGGLDISTQEAASAATDKIKAAINYVSDVRGTLGATQNRLDHTINNLSVMTENIQDAESTIRDTDVAAEMMAYTKNNILIQSAQAMLAQANQVPQGVLQLLQ